MNYLLSNKNFISDAKISSNIPSQNSTVYIKVSLFFFLITPLLRIYRWTNSFGGCQSTAEHCTGMFACNHLGISEASKPRNLHNFPALQTFHWAVLYRPWFFFTKTWILFIPILISCRITEPEKHLKISQLSSYLSKIKLKEYFFCMFTGNLDVTYKEWNYERRQAIAFFRLLDPNLGYESTSWSDER